MEVICFATKPELLPQIRQLGDIIRIHRAQIQDHKGNAQVRDRD